MARTLEEAAALYDQRRRVRALRNTAARPRISRIVGRARAMLEVSTSRGNGEAHSECVVDRSNRRRKELVARQFTKSVGKQQKLAV